MSTTSLAGDPRSRADAESMRLAGHEVVGVSKAPNDLPWVIPIGAPGLVERFVDRRAEDQLGRAAAASGADLYVPVHPNAIPAAERAAALRPAARILVKPGWSTSTQTSLIATTPSQPRDSLPSSGISPAHHVPGYVPGERPQGIVEVLMVHRKSDRSPGRYLEAALRRLGTNVTHASELDWEQVPGSTRMVVVVESPLPALEVRGVNPGIPVLFWAHHGEHHLEANLRLQRRYGANAVLLAHSWHLAFRFSGLVERMPFGVAPEITDSRYVAHDSRRYHVAYVGSDDRVRYASRFETIDSLRQSLGESLVRAESGLTPEEMLSLYRDSRVVIDISKGRHLPITMRVFEATGAGSLLATTGAPGMDLLFHPGDEYLLIGDDPTGALVERIESGTDQIARAGHERAWSQHTYDHRATELLHSMTRTLEEGVEPPIKQDPQSGPVGLVERFPDAQRILDLGDVIGEGLPDREVWPYRIGDTRAEPRTFHLAAVAGGTPSERHRAVAAARLGVITPRREADDIEPLVEEIHGAHQTSEIGDWSLFVFGTSGYRVSPDPDPV